MVVLIGGVLCGRADYYAPYSAILSRHWVPHIHGQISTSPKLFMDLAGMKFGARGTYRESRKGCPRGRANALSKRSGGGSLRWIREGPFVFVKWMDTWEVSLYSTIHPAFSGEAGVPLGKES